MDYNEFQLGEEVTITIKGKEYQGIISGYHYNQHGNYFWDISFPEENYSFYTSIYLDAKR